MAVPRRIIVIEEAVMVVTIRPYMWTGDGPLSSNPEDPGVDLVCADVFDLHGRMVGSLWRVYDTEWRIRCSKGGWTGEYASKKDAVAALQSA